MPENNLTQEQIEAIQIDYGIVFVDYGELTQRKLGPTRGGGEFTASKNIRNIEYDGSLGKTKGMQVIDEINAMLKCSILDMSQETLELTMPQADLDSGTDVITNNTGGLIPDSKYLTNITMFCKTIGGDYKKITLYNAMNEGDFTFAAAPKAEGIVALEVYAHWDATDQTQPLFEIEDVGSITEDLVAPTVVTVPADAAVAVVVSANLTATFNEAVRENDINSNNFILIKASDGSIVAGSLTYNTGSKIATFNPTVDLAAATDYIWMISGVRDLAGNTVAITVVNFTTA